MKRCVIIGGGECRDPAWLAGQLDPEDYVVAADRGLWYLQAVGRVPDLTVGDFDSYDGALPAGECVRLPREKDDTDMLYAARLGLQRGYRHFLLLGGMGGRLDHTLANLAVLAFLKERGASAVLSDRDCTVTLLRQETVTFTREEGLRYLSLFPYGCSTAAVSLTGVKYPLDHGTLAAGDTLGCSNELTADTAALTVHTGTLLAVRCADWVPTDETNQESRCRA